MGDMRYGRTRHGVTVIGGKLYVVGGKDERKSERFCLLKEVWEELPMNTDCEFGFGVTLISVKKRYAMAIGSYKNDNF